MTSSTALVVVDQLDGRLTVPSTEVLTVARRLFARVVAVWLGERDPGDEVVAELARYGAEQVYLPRLDGLAAQVEPVATEALAATVAAVEPAAVLLVSTFDGKERAAGLAVALDSGAISDVMALQWQDDRLVARKTIFAGSWDSYCAITRGVPVIAIKPTSYDPEPLAQPGGCEVRHLDVDFSARARSVEILERTVHPGEGGVPLPEAKVAVVGGRGTQGDFTLLEEFAELLGGAIGATRDVTEEGWISHTAQVGQTGVMIAPRLYIGLGVSGAVHHTAGMQASGTVVVVNEDAEAPLFEMADFGVVGDLTEVVPAAIEALRRHFAS